MLAAIDIENIDELRRCAGIDDVELHEDVARLCVGDHVLLTFLAGTSLRATLPVRITRIRKDQFRGRLVGTIARPELLGLRPNILVTFTAGQIHSIVQPQPAPRAGQKR